jgi:hypothetical protein
MINYNVVVDDNNIIINDNNMITFLFLLPSIATES